MIDAYPGPDDIDRYVEQTGLGRDDVIRDRGQVHLHGQPEGP